MLEQFHPAVREWFLKQFPAPTEPQAEAWPAIKSGKHTLIAAPTGSGKTLAAFLSAIDDLVWKAVEGTLTDETQVVYVSPLKALSNDIKINLEAPLRGIQENLAAAGIKSVEIRTLVRTGDTPAKDRVAMTKKPPHIIVTTPESLYILLTSDGGRRILSTTRTLIVDEIHAMVDDKRGSHLALSIERLEALVASGYAGVQPADEQMTAARWAAHPGLVRVGLSATQKPIEEVARFLVGTANIDADGKPRCTIIDSGHVRRLDLAPHWLTKPGERRTLGAIRIVHTKGRRRVVTAIEVFSLANKLSRAGRRQYELRRAPVPAAGLDLAPAAEEEAVVGLDDLRAGRLARPGVGHERRLRVVIAVQRLGQQFDGDRLVSVQPPELDARGAARHLPPPLFAH